MAQEKASLVHSTNCLTTSFPHLQYRVLARSLFIGQFFSYFFRCFFVLRTGLSQRMADGLFFVAFLAFGVT